MYLQNSFPFTVCKDTKIIFQIREREQKNSFWENCIGHFFCASCNTEEPKRCFRKPKGCLEKSKQPFDNMYLQFAVPRGCLLRFFAFLFVQQEREYYSISGDSRRNWGKGQARLQGRRCNVGNPRGHVRQETTKCPFRKSHVCI